MNISILKIIEKTYWRKSLALALDLETATGGVQ